MSKVYERRLGILFTQIQAISHLLLTAKKEPLKDPIFTTKGIEDWGRTFSNMIHDMPALWSGSSSYALIDQKLRCLRTNQKVKPSRDHFNSRQRCGEELAILITRCFGRQRAPTLKEVESILDRARRVHYVTEQENQRARPFMAQQMTPEQAYKYAGIKLRHNTQDLFSKRGRKPAQWKRDMYRKYG